MGAIKRIKTDRPDLFEYEIDGHMTADEIADLYGELEKAYKDHDKIDLVVRLTNLDGWDWQAAWAETTWLGKTHALSHIRRYAVIGGPAWLPPMIRAFDPFLKIRMRHFKPDEEKIALQWINDPVPV